jgi:hypothetical protein
MRTGKLFLGIAATLTSCVLQSTRSSVIENDTSIAFPQFFAHSATKAGDESVPYELDGVTLQAILPLLERMRIEGVVVLFKLDGERRTNPYTAAVSGPPLQGDALRIDTQTLEEALARIIVFYAEKRWGFAPPG